MANVLRKYLDQFDYQSDIGSLVQLATNIDDILIAEARGWLGAVAEQGLEIH